MLIIPADLEQNSATLPRRKLRDFVDMALFKFQQRLGAGSGGASRKHDQECCGEL
jgi:hypothetical protein